jgi:hypothetical protein
VPATHFFGDSRQNIKICGNSNPYNKLKDITKVCAHLETDTKTAETLADLEYSFMLMTIMDKHKYPIYGPKA